MENFVIMRNCSFHLGVFLAAPFYIIIVRVWGVVCQNWSSSQENPGHRSAYDSHRVNSIKTRLVLCVMTADDHSRVILDVAEDSLDSDYINASYIDVCSKFTEYFMNLGIAIFFYVGTG